MPWILAVIVAVLAACGDKSVSPIEECPVDDPVVGKTFRAGLLYTSDAAEEEDRGVIRVCLRIKDDEI